MGKFNDSKGEFNYMLSLTSRGDDGPITHVIYQQDICIHNKPTAKGSVSVNVENVKSGRDGGRLSHPGVGGKRQGPPSQTPSPVHVLGVRTHWARVASAPGMHSPHNKPIPNPVACQRRCFPEAGGGGRGAGWGNSPPLWQLGACQPQSPALGGPPAATSGCRALGGSQGRG